MAHELDALGEVSRFSDAELVCRLKQLVKADRVLTAKLLLHLGEVDERGLYREHGFSSMFEYCQTALGMSEAEACLRVHAAKVGRRFPLVVERLGAGAVHLSAIRLLSPHFTAENHGQLLERARGKSKRKIELLVAELAPRADVPASLRKLPSARGLINSSGVAASTAPDASSAPQACSTAPSETGSGSQSVLALQVAPAAAVVLAAPSQTFALQPTRERAVVTPLSPGRFKLTLTLGQDGHDKLEQLQELLRHQNPSGDLTRIIERALRELHALTLKQRFGQTRRVTSLQAQPKPEIPLTSDVEAKPRVRSESNARAKVSLSKSRYIPRNVLREVYARDNGQCTFVSSDGRRCAARAFLEVHHHGTTFARGGEATAENLRLSCRAHNALFAERDYGRGFMRAKLRKQTRTCSGSVFPELDQS